MSENKKHRMVGPHIEITLPVRISYRDTDQMGHVYYANYLVFFEMARGAMLREMGRSYGEVEAEGIMMPVLQAHVDYKDPAHYDDLIDIHARITMWTRARFEFAYECRRRSDDKLIATGTTRHVFMGSNRKISRSGDRLLPNQADLIGQTLVFNMRESCRIE